MRSRFAGKLGLVAILLLSASSAQAMEPGTGTLSANEPTTAVASERPASDFRSVVATLTERTSALTESAALPVDEEGACAACILGAIGISICCLGGLIMFCEVNPVACGDVLAMCVAACLFT